jgi:hypothetical protein
MQRLLLEIGMWFISSRPPPSSLSLLNKKTPSLGKEALSLSLSSYEQEQLKNRGAAANQQN